MADKRLHKFESLETRMLLAGDVGEALDIPLLHSTADSPHKVFLDFDGQIVTETSWNDYFDGRAIHAPAFSLDEDIFTLNADEVDRVIEIWERVSEDFAPFDVDVTTAAL